MDITIGELLQGGGTLSFAWLVYLELRTLRQALTSMSERLSVIEKQIGIEESK